jgi:hypothetical protein
MFCQKGYVRQLLNYCRMDNYIILLGENNPFHYLGLKNGLTIWQVLSFWIYCLWKEEGGNNSCESTLCVSLWFCNDQYICYSGYFVPTHKTMSSVRSKLTLGQLHHHFCLTKPITKLRFCYRAFSWPFTLFIILFLNPSNLMVLAQPCRKLSVNLNLSCSPLCCDLTYIHGALSIITVFIERLVGFFVHLFLHASDHL